MVVRVENYNKIVDELERQEIINGGVLSNSEYAKLLAIYLYQNDLLSAKFLWKRIPLSTKSAAAELQSIWDVGKAMRRKEYDEIYISLKFPWSAEIKPLMQMVEEEIRRNTLKLIAKSYSSLEIHKLSRYIGYDTQKTLAVAQENGWTNDGTYIFPNSQIMYITILSLLINIDKLYTLLLWVNFLKL
ncbi:hypothetical protein PGB90_001393 [Kerria lacca]